MKIRTGFVSNSSSSSFVVNSDITTSDLALIMLNVILEERRVYRDPDDIDGDGIKEAVQWLNENPEFNDPIAFPWSINESTFIWRNDQGNISVDTCNNHEWYEYIDYSGGQYDNDYLPYKDNVIVFLDLKTFKTVTKKEYWELRWGKTLNI